jgi:two-component sensor histidine kinase/PAS domain-containing protein
MKIQNQEKPQIREELEALLPKENVPAWAYDIIEKAVSLSKKQPSPLTKEDKNNTGKDNADRKTTEKLKNSERIAGVGSFLWTVKTNEIEFSDNLQTMFGFREQTAAPENFINCFEKASSVKNLFENAALNKENFRIDKLKISGQERFFFMEGIVSTDDQENPESVSGIVQDVTRQYMASKLVEEQKKFYEAILENIPVDIAIFNEEHKYLFLNPIAIKNPEIRSYMIGRDDFDYCRLRNISTELAVYRRNLFLQAKADGETINFEDSFVSKEGRKRYFLRRFFPVFSENREFRFMIGYGIDITIKKDQEIDLANSLEEKEVLLGEVHHRVKNNLTLILGLIEMQAAYSEDSTFRKQSSEIRSRILAMALIHDKMYKSSTFARIELNEYLTDLITSIAKFFSREKLVNMDLEIEPVQISSKTIVPLALLVNEIVTNAFKYAFTKTEEGVLSVRLSHDEKEILFSISDNGPGLPEGEDARKEKTLGFKLIGLFVKQLRGSYETNGSRGLNYTVRFPKD